MFELMIMLVVVGTSIWVLVDSTAIGARKGLLKGVCDMGPGGWFISSLALWIVGFPMYLSNRASIIDAVKNPRRRDDFPVKRIIPISQDPVAEWDRQQQATAGRSISVRPVAPAEPTIDCPTCRHPLLASAIRPGSNVCQKCGVEFVADVA
ncbi:MAG: hypothetical protein WCL71_12900 [Deltaproteobacteria bacterium]